MCEDRGYAEYLADQAMGDEEAHLDSESRRLADEAKAMDAEAGEQEMYLAMKLTRWEDVKLDNARHNVFPFPVSLTKSGGGEIGFCSVFDTYENALAFIGDPSLIQGIRGRTLRVLC